MSDDSSDEKERPLVAKTAVDLQRLKLMKLMKNPEKPVIIPERPKIKGTPSVPEFVRNVMGSSAGAGSGEFHVYRHLRRKEYSRQKYIQEKSQKELLDEEFYRKLEENKKLAQEITAKKRAKRLKKKQNMKKKICTPNQKKTTQEESSDSETEICNNDTNKTNTEVEYKISGTNIIEARNQCTSEKDNSEIKIESNSCYKNITKTQDNENSKSKTNASEANKNNTGAKSTADNSDTKNHTAKQNKDSVCEITDKNYSDTNVFENNQK